MTKDLTICLQHNSLVLYNKLYQEKTKCQP